MLIKVRDTKEKIKTIHLPLPGDPKSNTYLLS